MLPSLKMKSAFSAAKEKLLRGELSGLLRDALYFYPVGVLESRVSTPEGVALDLDGLSPATIGRYRMGYAEQQERKLLDHIPKDASVVEFGAGVGYVTVLVNRHINGKHLAIEPNPSIFPILNVTKSLNDATYNPINAVYHPEKQSVKFPDTVFFKTASIRSSKESEATVEATNLETICRDYDLDYPFLHVDIEGFEQLLFEKELDVIINDFSGLFIEIHNSRVDRVGKYIHQLQKEFEEYYRVDDKNNPVLLFKNKL